MMSESVSKETYDKAIAYYQNENKRLREALEFYANSKIYEAYCAAEDDYDSDAILDDGQIARQALEGEQHGPSTD